MSFDIRRCSREDLDELNRIGREHRPRREKTANDSVIGPQDFLTDELPTPSCADPGVKQ
jgi:hypothetical protein